MAAITALEIQQKNKERVNVYLDHEYAFSLDVMMAAALHKGQELTEAEIAVLKDQDAVSRAVDRAVRFLSYRPRSVAEIRRNLADKQIPDVVIDAAVERLKGLGYVDDGAFARYWVENRNTFKPLSPRALRYELREKGVANADINAALSDLDAQDAAYRAAQAQVRRYRSTSRMAFRNKLGPFLQRRGFGYDVIRDVVEQLIAEIELEDPDYFIADEE
ncbi:MAG: RecX family transcriptional regulator [Anaerolineae bacterium]|nr:RecX family transcriptional regulator [Anaerolineae bacterium]